jgi:hypothetical protein
MKKLYSLIIAALLTMPALKTIAQTTTASGDDGFSQLIKSSPADATKLVSAYALPLFKGFGTGLNSGWNNTAKTKKLLHFDLRVGANGAITPESDKSFDLTNIGLSKHLTVDATSPSKIAPTFGGASDAKLPIVDINDDNGTKLTSFTMPKALTTIIPAPNVQLTVGLVHNTDLTIRTMPTVKISSDVGTIGMIGFGIKHDLIQDFAKKVPKPFDLAIAVNYNRINYSKTLSVQPGSATPAPGQTAADFSNQRIDGHFSGTNFQAILSKKLLFFTPFVSVAYQTASTNIAVLGNYPITSTVPGQGSFYTVVKDPVSIDETSVSGMRADLGFQLNLAFLRIYVSGNLGAYKSINGAIGFGF